MSISNIVVSRSTSSSSSSIITILCPVRIARIRLPRFVPRVGLPRNPSLDR